MILLEEAEFRAVRMRDWKIGFCYGAVVMSLLSMVVIGSMFTAWVRSHRQSVSVTKELKDCRASLNALAPLQEEVTRLQQDAKEW